jgi:CheY-like chemotaxis protein
MEMSPVVMNRLVQQVLDLTRVRWNDMPQHKGHMVKLITDFAPDLPAINGVENELRDALTNLIFNASDSMPEDGTLTLRTQVVGRRSAASQEELQSFVSTEVIDTGIGMDEDTRRRCLEPFFTTKGERGTGLGLAMVYGAIKRHGGEIEIESTPGTGTIMRLLFPVATESATPSAEPFVPPSAIEPMRILIVDDDPLLIKSLRDTLDSAGHLVTTADGGQLGIDTFAAALNGSDPFEVVITDLGMPYLDGRRVATTVKELSPTTPIIMLTGWGQRMVTQGEIPANVDCVLSKPPKLRELNQALARFAQAKKTALTS